jgi:hypothetical protein
MRRTISSAAVLASFVLAACGEQRTPTEVAHTKNSPVALTDGLEPGHAGGIVAHDACDPLTLNATPFGPRTCLKEGRTTFDDFIAQVIATQSAKGWHFTSDEPTARLGNDMLGNNVGGEVHTFTPVRQFGGSIIDPLNELLGNPVVAQECRQLDDDDLVAAGAKYRIEAEELAAVVDASGIARVQCCIHPWMRSEIQMKS